MSRNKKIVGMDIFPVDLLDRLTYKRITEADWKEFKTRIQSQGYSRKVQFTQELDDFSKMVADRIVQNEFLSWKIRNTDPMLIEATNRLEL